MMNPPGSGCSRMRGPSSADMRDITSAPGLSPSECSLSVLNLPPYRLAALSQVIIIMQLLHFYDVLMNGGSSVTI